MLQEDQITGECPPITAYGPGFFVVGRDRLDGPVAITSDAGPVPIKNAVAMVEDWLSRYEVVLVGSGDVRLVDDALIDFLEEGLEVMASDAAARTFNVCLAEKRKVAALLQPPTV